MSRNVSGQAYALTVLTPIRDGHLQPLTAHLDALPDGAGSPLARVPRTHLARWVVIDDVKFQGAGQRRRDNLTAARLLFTSNFDGDLDAYLEGLRTGMAEAADEVWSHCVGYPGHGERAAFADWFKAHQLEAALFFGAYGAHTVEEVHRNVDVRNRLIGFALEAQALDATDLKGRFLETFAMTVLDFPNIQGFVVRGYRLPCANYLFVRIDDGASARALLADVMPQVLTAERWDVKPESGVNLAFTYDGLRAIGLPESALAGFSEEFKAGMASRASVLGDIGESAPEHWEEPFQTGDAHVLVMISAQRPRGARGAQRAHLRADRARGRDDRGRRPARRRAADRPRALRLRGRLLAAGDRGQPLPRPSGRRCARQGRRVAPGPRRRVHPRLPRRAGLAARRARAGRVQHQRHLRRLPQAAPGRRRASAARCAQAR